MQYTSRVYIRFKDKETWEKVLGDSKIGSGENARSLLSFKDDPFAGFSYFRNGLYVSEKTLSCEISDFFDENATLKLVEMFASAIGKNGIIIADTFSYSCDPICFEYYYFGEEIHPLVRTKGAENHFSIIISDIEKWLGTTRKKTLSPEEKALLKECL